MVSLTAVVNFVLALTETHPLKRHRWVEEVDALLRKELFLFEEREDFVSEKPFGGLGVDVGNRPPVPLTVPCAARRDCVDVRMPPEVIRGRLYDGDHARAITVARTRSLSDELGHRLPSSSAKFAKQFAAVEEIGSEQFWDREGPHRVAHRLDNLLAQESTKDGGALCGT